MPFLFLLCSLLHFPLNMITKILFFYGKPPPERCGNWVGVISGDGIFPWNRFFWFQGKGKEVPEGTFFWRKGERLRQQVFPQKKTLRGRESPPILRVEWWGMLFSFSLSRGGGFFHHFFVLLFSRKGPLVPLFPLRENPIFCSQVLFFAENRRLLFFASGEAFLFSFRGCVRLFLVCN